MVSNDVVLLLLVCGKLRSRRILESCRQTDKHTPCVMCRISVPSRGVDMLQIVRSILSSFSPSLDYACGCAILSVVVGFRKGKYLLGSGHMQKPKKCSTS
jgi:hypothetical protein